ncbi:hypothetical protein BC833DRAFT_567759 [Globomyces pollinis-pini]|nr:hypothetical protein BC833DRAFT_567759 [Globomyces pollinis-pini]
MTLKSRHSNFSILMTPTTDDLRNMLIAVSIGFPLASLIGLYSLIRQIMHWRSSAYSQTYLYLLLILKYFALQIAVTNTLVVFVPACFPKSRLGYSLVKFFSGWPHGLISILLMVCDMEMLKLLKVIAPFFTSRKIVIIQAIEVIVGFILGGGIFYFPLSSMDSFAFMYIRLSILLHILSSILVVIQCLFISYKMLELSLQTKHDSKLQVRFYKVVAQVILFMVLDLIGIVVLVIAASIISETAGGVANLFGDCMFSLVASFNTLKLHIYGLIFQSIKEIKFNNQKTAPKVGQVRVADGTDINK